MRNERMKRLEYLVCIDKCVFVETVFLGVFNDDGLSGVYKKYLEQ